MIDLRLGDCLSVMAGMAENSIDSIVTDPPYSLGFMGRDWDKQLPGVEYWQAALRVAKPGAILMSFGGDRTHHRLMCAIEDAGWEIRTCIYWIFGSGFPKSLALDKATGDDKWAGYGTALKPAAEIIILAMKPLDGTFAQNAERWGVAGLWIDGGRVGTTVETWPCSRSYAPGQIQPGGKGKTMATGPMPAGRWPANLIHDGSDEVLAGFPVSSTTGKRTPQSRGATVKGTTWLADNHESQEYIDTGSASRFFYCAKASRAERDTGLDDLPEIPCGMMEDDNYPIMTGSGNLRDTKRHNGHPTVKPLALMRYLVRLSKTPTGGGVVLDPFMGSGTTGMAAVMEGRDFVGIELKADYLEIAKRRIAAAQPALIGE